jgi:hypothetical protein
MGWTLTDSQWQVELVRRDRTIEKIAYTNYFFAADAAYKAALTELPNDKILFRNRARIIRRNWEGDL